MYVCLECGREFNEEEEIQKHFLACWKERHPFHKSNPAPRSANIEFSKGNENILAFLNQFKEK